MHLNAAVIGLGSMGGAMASTLARAGWKVTGFDPSPEARARAAAEGISTVDTLQAVAGTPYVVLSLPSARIVALSVPILLGVPGAVAIIDTTTSEPETSAAMSALAEEHGAAFIDAPVSGGRAGALSGTLSAFVGATDAALRAAAPILDALTSSHRHIGGPGTGNVVKLLNNVLCAANLASVGEALAVATAYGIDPSVAAAGISAASGASRVSTTMYPDWVLSGTHDSGFALGLMARDAALAITIATSRGEHPRLLAAASDLWQEGLEQLGPDADFTEISTTVAPALATRAGASATAQEQGNQ
ncbi:NAD(P)-dependent oxidoreductase [Paeniglutamicibacter cryotolerans]|uniref:3-hydroxyisobutyrate dehydrogenase n=1 Tax=Paeniglutamicibacter cryotolerans TaxID=670079 RepID=A0A839QLC4_9MICC|nr:NAD(P)-dependent oxidoreductase [Paeniglutamicibacter cryotolerans]MBB2995564.1 3-hydroxyisobutyrate dehydrogenase [Paeniglutamicibacter cryotolerans]